MAINFREFFSLSWQVLSRVVALFPDILMEVNSCFDYKPHFQQYKNISKGLEYKKLET